MDSPDVNFLKKFCSLLENTEVPPRFSIWCGLATLLAVLERRIWLHQGIYTVYPNFYFVLIAASGQKKSTAINLTDKLLRSIDPGPKIIAQMITPEGLINAIKVVRLDNDKELLKETSGGIIIADELVTLIDKRAIEKGLGKVLTTLYDCKDVFEYQTVSRGLEKVYNSHLSLLGGTTVELIKDSIPLQAVGGGLTSRMLFIYDDSLPPPVPWVEYNEEHRRTEQDLIRYLQELSTLEGEIYVTPEAREFYIQDYTENYSKEIRKNPYLRGYANRRHAHLFKIAMGIMVAENPSLTMNRHHLQGAKIILEEAETHMEKVVEMIVSTESGSSISMVYNFIDSQPDKQVTRSTLTRYFSHRFDAIELKKMLDTLIQANRIEFDTEGRALVYRVKR